MKNSILADKGWNSFFLWPEVNEREENKGFRACRSVLLRNMEDYSFVAL